MNHNSKPRRAKQNTQNSQCLPALPGDICPYYNHWLYTGDGVRGVGNCNATAPASSSWSLFGGRRRLQGAAALYDKNGLPLAAGGALRHEAARVRHDVPLPAPVEAAPLLSDEEAGHVPLARMVPLAALKQTGGGGAESTGARRRAALLAAQDAPAPAAAPEPQQQPPPRAAPAPAAAAATTSSSGGAAADSKVNFAVALASQHPKLSKFVACKKLCCPACTPPPETVEVGRLLTTCPEGCALADAASGRCACPGAAPPACPLGKIACGSGPAAAAALCVDLKRALASCAAADACAAKGPIDMC